MGRHAAKIMADDAFDLLISKPFHEGYHIVTESRLGKGTEIDFMKGASVPVGRAAETSLIVGNDIVASFC